MVMALSLSALELVMENHFYPLMKLVSPVLRSAAVFERRVRRHLAAVGSSSFRVSPCEYPHLWASRFWDEHPHSVPWAVFAVVSTRCRDVCRARLRHLDLARIPALPSRVELAYLRSVVTHQYISRVPPVRARSDHERGLEARGLLAELEVLQGELRTIMTRLSLAARRPMRLFVRPSDAARRVA